MSEPTQPQTPPADPAAAPATPPSAVPPGAHIGEIIPYFGDESNGTNEHPAIVTRKNDDGTYNATIFFDGSAPGHRMGLTLDQDGLHQPARPAAAAAEPDGA